MDQYATPIGPKKFLICPLSWLQKSGEKIANKSQKNFWEQKYWQILSSRIKCWTKKFSQQKILQEFESSFRWRQESERDIDRERVCVGLRVENERERGSSSSCLSISSAKKRNFLQKCWKMERDQIGTNGPLELRLRQNWKKTKTA